MSNENRTENDVKRILNSIIVFNVGLQDDKYRCRHLERLKIANNVL